MKVRWRYVADAKENVKFGEILPVFTPLTSHKSFSNLCSMSDRLVDNGTAPTKW